MQTATPEKKTAASRPVFTLELIPIKSVQDPNRALQALLKAALRSYGLRCRSLKTRNAGGEL